MELGLCALTRALRLVLVLVLVLMLIIRLGMAMDPTTLATDTSAPRVPLPVQDVAGAARLSLRPRRRRRCCVRRRMRRLLLMGVMGAGRQWGWAWGWVWGWARR